MIVRLSCAGLMMISPCFFTSAASAQDIPGIEICTAEKTMERRTSCLQSNINFQQTTLAKITADYQQRIDAAKAQIEALRATLVSLQKTVDDLKSAQAKQAEDLKKKADAPAAKEGTTAKDAGK
jgi:hypothetical protein